MTNSEKNCAYDPLRCREVWKRVCPGEDVYPAPAAPPAEEQELALPGAQQDPCCMGSDAVGTIEVLQGFLREELGDAQLYAHLASVLPREMRGVLRAMSEAPPPQKKISNCLRRSLIFSCFSVKLQLFCIFVHFVAIATFHFLPSGLCYA